MDQKGVKSRGKDWQNDNFSCRKPNLEVLAVIDTEKSLWRREECLELTDSDCYIEQRMNSNLHQRYWLLLLQKIKEFSEPKSKH